MHTRKRNIHSQHGSLTWHLLTHTNEPVVCAPKNFGADESLASFSATYYSHDSIAVHICTEANYIAHGALSSRVCVVVENSENDSLFIHIQTKAGFHQSIRNKTLESQLERHSSTPSNKTKKRLKSRYNNSNNSADVRRTLLWLRIDGERRCSRSVMSTTLE